MPRNGSGTYTLPAGNPVVSGTTISSTWANNTLSDIATALTGSLTKDGQTTPTANIPMGGFKLTGLAAGTATGNSLRWEQLFSQGAPTDIASASTTDIGSTFTNFLNVTGTTTITSLGTNYNGPKMLRFTGILTLTHNATTLVLPTAANITTAAGDTCIAIPKSTTSGIADGWQIIAYQKASGLPVNTAGFALSGANNDITALNALTTPLTAAQGGAQLLPFTASVTANALTISLANTSLDFRNPSLPNGAPIRVSTGALSITVPLTSNLGRLVSAQVNRIEVVVAYNGGTPVLCVNNMAGWQDISESGLISPTTIGAASNSSSIFYSASAVAAGSSYRRAGYVDATFTDATGWISPLTKVQPEGDGGAGVGGPGWGETPILVVRTIGGGPYYNTLGRPMRISGRIITDAGGLGVLNVMGVAVQDWVTTGGFGVAFSETIPAGGYYSFPTGLAVTRCYEWK